MRGLGTGAAITRAAARTRGLLRAIGVGRKTAKVTTKWGAMIANEALMIQGSNILGKAFWEREEINALGFATGVTAGQMVFGRYARLFSLFNKRMLAKQGTSAAANLWGTGNRLIKNNPALIGSVGYVPKKAIQAGIGTATITAGGTTESLYKIFKGEMTWTEMWDHTMDADSLIETYGTLLVIGSKSVFKDGVMGVRNFHRNIQNVNGATGKWNQVAKAFGLPSISKYSKKNYNDPNKRTNWTSEEISDAYNKKVKEINANEKTTPEQKLAEIENLGKLKEFLELKKELDVVQEHSQQSLDAYFGKKSLFGQYKNLMDRVMRGESSNLMDQYTLGKLVELDFAKDPRVRKRLALDLVEASGGKLSLNEANAYIKQSRQIYEIAQKHGFESNSPELRKFLRANSKAMELDSQLKDLKKRKEAGEIDDVSYKLDKEIIDVEQSKLLEREKGILKAEKERIKKAQQEIIDNITAVDYIETENVNKEVIDLLENNKGNLSESQLKELENLKGEEFKKEIMLRSRKKILVCK